jgi:exopolysaccharide biosynthesis polyprenyl glycosylphosphotransferase
VAHRGPTPASRARAHPGHTSALAAQRIFSVAGVRLAPAFAAAIVASLHSGFGDGALLGLGVLFCASALERKRYPLHLMPLGGALARALAPLAGVIGGWLLSLTLSPMAVDELAAPLGAAWVVLAAVLAIGHRLESGFQVRVAVIGSPGLAQALDAELETFNINRWQVVGWMDFTDDGLIASTDGPPLLGFVQEMAEVIDHNAIDLIVFGVRESEREAGAWLGVDSIGVLERVVETCVGLDVRVIGANQFFEEAFGHVPLAAINAAWFQYIMHPRFRAASPVGKRALDLGVAALVSIFALPLLAAAAVAIKLHDRGPILYRQRRVGEAGREFEILKLRTMGVDAESNGAQWAAVAGDPRVTGVGRILRRTHLDELPQLWNVLRGDMSIVGPRPERPEFVRDLERKLPFYDRRLVIKPGVTGWAQVSCGYAGTDSGSVWKLAHDLFYLKHRSTLFDLLIIVETLATPVRDARRANREPAAAFVKQVESAHGIERAAV